MSETLETLGDLVLDVLASLAEPLCALLRLLPWRA